MINRATKIKYFAKKYSYVSFCAFSDFLKYFQELDICHISHDIDQDITFHGRWEVGLNAGGVQKADWKNFAKNPQCFIRLSDNDPIDPAGRSSAIVSLMQRRQPISRAKGMNKIGFRVYRVDETTEELSAPFFSYRRNDGKIHPLLFSQIFTLNMCKIENEEMI